MRIKVFKMIRRWCKWSSVGGALVFLLYVCLFIFHGVLITSTQTDDKKYSYSTITVVLGTELLKLAIAVVLYWTHHPIRNIFRDIHQDLVVLGLYLVPAFLYCLYNNLAFVNLSNFDPTTYYLLLQFRVVITGILFQIIFKKWLSKMQWFSLVLLTFGCLLKQVEFDWTRAPQLDMERFLNYRILFVVFQTCCSCFAGVYNEYLLKKKGATADIYLQNIFMYLDSIVFNVLVLFVVDRDPLAAFSAASLSKLGDYRVILIMVNSALVGIITSFFLQKFNSILKVFAGALELICTAVISYLFFRIPVLANTIVSILIVSLAIALYTFYPERSDKGQRNNSPEVAQINQNSLTILDLEMHNRLPGGPGVPLSTPDVLEISSQSQL